MSQLNLQPPSSHDHALNSGALAIRLQPKLLLRPGIMLAVLALLPALLSGCAKGYGPLGSEAPTPSNVVDGGVDPITPQPQLDASVMTMDSGVPALDASPDGSLPPGVQDAANPTDAANPCDAASGCGMSCSQSPCRLVSPQCGCPTDFGCYLDGTTGRLCATSGTLSEGDLCNSRFGCQPGLLCLELGTTTSTSVGACMRYCDDDLDCHGDGSLCVLTLSDGSGGSGPVTACTRSCDPISNASCPTGTKCFIGTEPTGALRDLTHCNVSTGTGIQSTPCTLDDDCSTGFLCGDPDGSGLEPTQCLKWCDVDAGGPQCPTSTTCRGFSSALTIGSREYGACF